MSSRSSLFSSVFIGPSGLSGPGGSLPPTVSTSFSHLVMIASQLRHRKGSQSKRLLAESNGSFETLNHGRGVIKTMTTKGEIQAWATLLQWVWHGVFSVLGLESQGPFFVVLVVFSKKQVHSIRVAFASLMERCSLLISVSVISLRQGQLMSVQASHLVDLL